MADKIADGIRFRPDFDAFWPDYDHAPETCFKFVQRGLPDADATARLCRERHICVQAGAHAGFWPRRLSRYFRTVYAFECEPTLFECAKRNLHRWRTKNVILSNCGLGAQPGTSKMRPHRSAGSWSIDPIEGTVPVNLVTIDGLGLKSCDAIILDVEGWEVEALLGAQKTIDQFRPIIHVEVLPEAADGIAAHMKILRYRLAMRSHKDSVYRPEERV